MVSLKQGSKMWVLIWIVLGYHSMTSGTQEFNSEEACELAKDKLKRGARGIFECVEKGHHG